MPASTPHLQHLIAYYLAEHYPSVLEPFLEAAQIPRPNVSSPPSPDLRTLLQDYISHRLVEQLSEVDLDDRMEPAQDGSWRGWEPGDMMKVEMAQEVRLSGVRRTLEGISASNLLTVEVVRVPKREFNTACAE